MALYTLLVQPEGESFGTQCEGANVEKAVHAFFAHQVAEALSPKLGPEHIMYITPMEGLVNVWAVCAGRHGRYTKITVVRSEGIQGI
ncbi:hypothetical protein LJR074_003745 [Acidovorax sp. LjRoot74]|uniref:hypothetical protein n=1 Tax=Acidovorax sp. LjRoot74 TaxID=3342337 RepID=UPI003ECEA326